MQASVFAKIKIFASMFIFGTIGIFVRRISLPSEMIALARGVIGVAFLSLLLLLQRKRIDLQAVKKNLVWLLLSGSALGFNWMLLFEAYNYTSVATATLCYYMAPIFIILASPFLLKERLSGRKCLCVLLALLGMVCISGILQTGIPSHDELLGILSGLAAALLYAAIVLMNRKISGISAYDKTILQLGISALLMLPYCLFTSDLSGVIIDGSTVFSMLLLGVVHTGFAYFLYFGALHLVSAQTSAMISYVDPAIAVLASVLVLKEAMTLPEIIGAVLILGAAIMSEVTFSVRKKEE